MRLIKSITSTIFLVCLFHVVPLYAETSEHTGANIDRIELVREQINLLKNRLQQTQQELNGLQQQHDEEISQLTLEKASKNLLDKAALDISVAQSNVDSVDIELNDAQQALGWLEKNVQEINNQLNVLGIFGLKVAKNEKENLHILRNDLSYQQKIIVLEKHRVSYLQQLQNISNSILQFRNDRFNRLNALLKSRRLLHFKEQQVRDELAYQEQQTYWLQQVNIFNAKLVTIDPVQYKAQYGQVERDIFYASENANLAYVQSLIARYKDQMQQMRLTITKSNSISLLNEIGDQEQTLVKQFKRLDALLQARMSVLNQHIKDLTPRESNPAFKVYVQKLKNINIAYLHADQSLAILNEGITSLRSTLEQALQSELSARQGFPTFNLKTFLDLGKETLLVPALSFQVVKSLSSYLFNTLQELSALAWLLFGLVEVIFFATMVGLYRWLKYVSTKPSEWREQINSKWLSLEWLRRNFIDVMVIINLCALLYYVAVPWQNFVFVFYLSLVWLAFKSIITIARLVLVETTHDSGHDMRLYKRLRWIIFLGAVITAFTVFVHQLPLIYELKVLCDRLFLCLMMVISLLLLRSWDVVPNLILSHMDRSHPYFRKSICFIGILIPLLLLGNSAIGMLGFVNLIMTVSWYEGVFMVVLIGYLIVRGLLSDGMEQLSRLLIQYVNNGWLWTEAFLKPLDKVLRISLFLMAGALLFLLYGWDNHSPIVERLTRLLHYQLATISNTMITPINIIELSVVISIFYWTAKWTREFVYRLLLSRTKDMGIRNSIAILSQYSVVVIGMFIGLRVLGIDLRALTYVTGMFAVGIGFGLRDLANNYVTGFFLLLERPLRVGDIVNVSGLEGEVTHIGGRAITVRTWDHMELMVPNAEIFNKSFTNWTARDNIVRTVSNIKISRYDNPHEVKVIIYNVLAAHKEVLKDPAPEVYLREMNDSLINFEIRYYVNIRQVISRTKVLSSVLMNVWDEFALHGIKAPYPQQEILLRTQREEVQDLHPSLENRNG